MFWEGLDGFLKEEEEEERSRKSFSPLETPNSKGETIAGQKKRKKMKPLLFMERYFGSEGGS